MNRKEWALYQAMPLGQKMSAKQIESLDVRINKGTREEIAVAIDLKLIQNLKEQGSFEETWDERESIYVYRKRTSAEMIELMNGKY